MSKERIKKFFDDVAGDYYDERYKSVKDLCSAEMISRKLAVLSLLDKFEVKNGKLLDAGCGSGVMVQEFLSRGFEVCGIDVSQKMIDEANKFIKNDKAHFSVGDVESLNFPADTFDVVVSIGVLDYLEADDAVIKEFKRVLKPGGVAVLSVSNKFSPVHVLRTSLLPFVKGIFQRQSHEKVYCAKFSTRAHNPWGFNKLLVQAKFDKLDYAFVGSSFIPFNVKLPQFLFSKLMRLSKSPFGSGYVVIAKKK